MAKTREGSTVEVVKVDRDACIPCGACSAVCPREALILEGMTLVVISERCRPCGQAAFVCPTGALRCPAPGGDTVR
ncbi:MAG TPA: 4Fe-4S dicluster domain-containing protein [Patescibacteria group bacterium]|nr:4Fe-4S dicluster domain-containing protein [Patescibacteria group bacterium]